MSKHSGLFPYAGGKGEIIDIFRELMNMLQPDCFFDLFGGSGAVTLSISLGSVPERNINDIDPSLAIIYMVFADYDLAMGLYNIIKDVILSQNEIDSAKKRWFDFLKANKAINLTELSQNKDSFLSLAADVYLLHICSYSGILKSSKTTFTKKMFEMYESHKKIEWILDCVQKMQGVQITNRNALDIITELHTTHNFTKRSLIYVDPPYLSSNMTNIITGKTYRYSMTKEDHLTLLNALNNLDSKQYFVIVSNYSNDIYDEFSVKKKWRKELIFYRNQRINNGSSNYFEKKVEECIYCNF